MATAVASRQKLRSDDIFFPAAALLILGIVFTGFSKTYFLAGMMRAKLPNTLVHIHGGVFVSWVLLLVAQPWLIVAHKVKWHMRLGVLSLIFVPSMVILGVVTLFDFIRRSPPDEGFLKLLLIGDLEIITLFVVLTSWGLLARRDAASHKRLMILGTIAIMGPAIDRWHFGIPATLGVTFGLPLLVLVYDLCVLKRVHRTTAVATALTALWVLTIVPLAKLAFWHQCVEWIRHA